MNNASQILIVEDQYVMRVIMKKHLGDMQLHIHEANDGVEALALLRQKDNVACILMDINMPKMDGIQTALVLRKIDRYKNTPLIFCTALRDDEIHIPDTLEQYTLLHKPFTREALRTAIAAQLEGEPRDTV